MKDNFLECVLEHNWFDMRLYETRWDKMERDNVIYGYDTTLHSVIDKRRDKPGTPKQNPIHQHSAWKQEQAPLFAMGHLSHAATSGKFITHTRWLLDMETKPWNKLWLYYIPNASRYEVQTVHIGVYLLGTTLVLIATACLHKTYYLCYT